MALGATRWEATWKAVVPYARTGIMGSVFLALARALGETMAVTMNGVPSIVIGIFAYALVVMPVHHFSTLAGGFALGVMMIPIVLRSTEEFLHAVPRAMREGAMALGASKWRTISSVTFCRPLRAA